MDNTPQTTAQQPTNEDQELAAALANVLPGASDPGTLSAPTDNQPAAETPAEPEATEAASNPPTQTTTQVDINIPPVPSIDASAVNSSSSTQNPISTPPAGDLESIKKNALGELRPIIDKVDLPAEEKFDTYLMLIRSTDDKDLIAPAHAVALTIADDKRKAEALLDIIKEIDYLSRTDQPSN